MGLGWRRVLAAGMAATIVGALFATPSQAAGAQGVGSAGGSTTLAALAAGIAKIDSANVDLGSVAGPDQSTSSRSVTVNGVTVLDLRALLQMVGLDLNKLPLQTLADLIQQLGLLDALNAATGQNFGS